MSLYNLVGLVPLVAGCYLLKHGTILMATKGASPLTAVLEQVSL